MLPRGGRIQGKRQGMAECQREAAIEIPFSTDAIAQLRKNRAEGTRNPGTESFPGSTSSRIESRDSVACRTQEKTTSQSRLCVQ